MVIVCKEAESKIINHIFSKTGAQSKVQAIITQGELKSWYDRSLSSSYSKSLGASLLSIFHQEFQYEFPFVGTYLNDLFEERKYNNIEMKNWL